jgi:alkyl hydroperoxide reductase subunit F
MLDPEIKEQLRSALATLENSVELVYLQSEHADQSQLVTMLSDVSSTNSKITVEALPQSSPTPEFFIRTKGVANGIFFRGIPGGHEFTSLILAILNSDHKGKFPDSLIVERIKNLKGPIEVKTYISLTCENCPDVVQALNQMAIIHKQFKHEMIDGAYVPDEIKDLGIQGVPSIVVNKKMIHSGRIQFIDLLVKLEEIFGTTLSDVPLTPQNLGHFNIAVVGGGPAGASAAIYSVRKGSNTVLIAERIGGQVQETKGIENLVSVIYTEGPQLAAQLQQHLESYPVKILEHRRVKSISDTNPKHIVFESGESLSADSVIITTGAKWRELGIPGEKDYLGRGVAFCPHCDGPYYKGKKIAVVGGGNSGVEAAIDLAGIVREVILFEFQDQLKADQVLVQKLQSMPNITVITSAKTTQILGDGQKVVALEYQDRTTAKSERVNLDGVFVQIGLLPNSGFVKELVETTKFGEIIVDSKGRTSKPGIYAAGDVTTVPYKQIIIAMGEGAKAALAAFEDRMLQH